MKINMKPTRIDLKSVDRILAALCLILSAGFLASCSSMNTQRMEYAGAPHYQPSNPHSVAILRSTPARPHERLGEVVIDASADNAPSVAKVEEKLRKEAASMGADAAVIIYDGVLPTTAYVTGPSWSRTVETGNGRKLVGVAIRYQDGLGTSGTGTSEQRGADSSNPK